MPARRGGLRLLRGAVDSGKYDVLGVLTDDDRARYVWIVLNVNAGTNGIYAMPQHQNFTLPCGYLDQLESNESIDPTVKAALRGHCQAGSGNT
jgi:hypothetical protein